VEVVIAWAKTLVKKAEQFGIPKEQVILDPGIGFGKSALQSLDIIVHMDDIMRAVPDVPWLVGHSRKSFLSLFSPVPAIERDGVTLAISALLCDQCVDIVRVHEVVGHRRLAEGWARL